MRCKSPGCPNRTNEPNRAECWKYQLCRIHAEALGLVPKHKGHISTKKVGRCLIK